MVHSKIDFKTSAKLHTLEKTEINSKHFIVSPTLDFKPLRVNHLRGRIPVTLAFKADSRGQGEYDKKLEWLKYPQWYLLMCGIESHNRTSANETNVNVCSVAPKSALSYIKVVLRLMCIQCLIVLTLPTFVVSQDIYQFISKAWTLVHRHSSRKLPHAWLSKKFRAVLKCTANNCWLLMDWYRQSIFLVTGFPVRTE